MLIACKYFLYFLVYSILGALSETLYRLLTEHHLYAVHGFLHLPILPIYGVGAVLIILLLKSHKRNPVLLFVSSTLLASALEFVTHWLIEVIFKTDIWSYANNPFNLYGRISLESSIGFGIGAIIVVYFIHPLVSKLIDRLPRLVIIPISLVFGTVVFIDFVWSVIGRLT